MRNHCMNNILGVLAATILLTGCGIHGNTNRTDEPVQNISDEYASVEPDQSSSDVLTPDEPEQNGKTDSDRLSRNQSQENGTLREAEGELDESRILQEQSFEVELNDWGAVRFVSCEPAEGADPSEDVSFYLVRDGQIIYEFPYTGPDHTSGYGVYYGITFVMFMDTNQDERKDVVIGAEYLTGAGPQGAIPHMVVRIYEDCGDAFIYRKELCDEINSNLPWESSFTAGDIREMIESMQSGGNQEAAGNPDAGSAESPAGYERYSGFWSQTGESHEEILENGGMEMTCRIRNGNEFSGEIFAVQWKTQRIAEVENITGIIENGELFFPMTDDGWGGTGMLHIMFLDDGISIDVLDYEMAEDNATGYGISGYYELVRE